MEITKEQILRINPKAVKVDTYLPLLNRFMNDYGIDTPLRAAHFIAQVMVESGSFSRVEENMNYSAERLLQVFPKYFSKVNASGYAHNQRKIGNKVYASRMGNGNEASGDGYKYRGHGLIQLTGKDMYRSFMEDCKMDVVREPDLLAKPLWAARSACWFWKHKGLNTLADLDDCLGVTKRINGGTNALAERRELTRKAKEVLL